MQHPEDFVYEFFQILEHRIAEWANSLGVHRYLGDVDLRNPLECFANYAHFAKRNEYCRLRSQGMTPQSAISRLVKLPMPEKRMDGSNLHLPSEAIISKWDDLLRPLKGQPVYYAHIPRMIEYLLPFISKDPRNAILITESKVSPELLKFPNNVTLVKFVDSGCRLFSNDFLERNFPIFFSFANTIALLDQCIEPPEFACICGCNIQARIWAQICNYRGAETICYQHGWPAFMHAGFAAMPFKTMATWGSSFIDLWQPRNPSMKFVNGFYPYPIEKHGSHDRVTFFLQEPYFVATNRTQQLMLRLIAETATRYPDKIIQYRIHPEAVLQASETDFFAKFNNIINVTDVDLAEVYASTRVAIAHYSSTIMECIVHGCCPMVFNPTPNWDYLPDLEKEGIGFISTDVASFHDKLKISLRYRISTENIAKWYNNIATSPVTNTPSF